MSDITDILSKIKPIVFRGRPKKFGDPPPPPLNLSSRILFPPRSSGKDYWNSPLEDKEDV
jgi:hypothetical protein